jgi:microcystin-dependent protein
MSGKFLGEIIIGGWNFAPKGYAFCNGQTMSISQNTALFSLLGTTFGGNGTSTFALPNLQSRVPIHYGQGSGLTSYSLGETGGVESVTLTAAQIPAHSHLINAYSVASDSHTPNSTYLAKSLANGTATYSDQTPDTTMHAGAIANNTGGGGGHENRQPFLALNFVIALQGIFPSRN